MGIVTLRAMYVNSRMGGNDDMKLSYKQDRPVMSCCGARNLLLAGRSQDFDRCHSLLLASSAAGGARKRPRFGNPPDMGKDHYICQTAIIFAVWQLYTNAAPIASRDGKTWENRASRQEKRLFIFGLFWYTTGQNHKHCQVKAKEREAWPWQTIRDPKAETSM